MLINVRVNDEEQALEFVNDVLEDLGKEQVENPTYTGNEIQIIPEQRAEHISDGPKDITIESYLSLSITVDDLDYETQQIVMKHKNLLHRL
ncbi:MAG: hypothetical protein ACNS60_05480 [Candidatus Cyclobacteriaceae bacterium M2_1C_046]